MVDEKTNVYLNQLSARADEAHGPDKYVIRGFQPLVRAMADVEKAALSINHSVEKSVTASNKVEDAIAKLEKSTNKTEKVMMYLTAASLIFAAVQVVVAYIGH